MYICAYTPACEEFIREIAEGCIYHKYTFEHKQVYIYVTDLRIHQLAMVYTMLNVAEVSVAAICMVT